jgi:hypothetical protein
MRSGPLRSARLHHSILGECEVERAVVAGEEKEPARRNASGPIGPLIARLYPGEPWKTLAQEIVIQVRWTGLIL